LDSPPPKKLEDQVLTIQIRPEIQDIRRQGISLLDLSPGLSVSINIIAELNQIMRKIHAGDGQCKEENPSSVSANSAEAESGIKR
jgi:hypothetical protein